MTLIPSSSRQKRRDEQGGCDVRDAAIVATVWVGDCRSPRIRSAAPKPLEGEPAGLLVPTVRASGNLFGNVREMPCGSRAGRHVDDHSAVVSRGAERRWLECDAGDRLDIERF